MQNMQLRHQENWNGSYKGVSFKISHHGVSEYQPKGIWCFYIYVDERQLPKSFDEFWLEPRTTAWGSITYDYNEPRWNGLDFHGGITWYEKVSNVDEEFKCVQIGCDYNHIWDEGRHYSPDAIAYDVRSCIDSFHEMYSEELQLRCGYTGKYHPLSELVPFSDENPMLVHKDKSKERIDAQKLLETTK